MFNNAAPPPSSPVHPCTISPTKHANASRSLTPIPQLVVPEGNKHPTRSEKPFLNVDFQAVSTIRYALGKKAAESTVPDPPMNVYAQSDNWVSNLKSCRAWFTEGESVREKWVCEYNAMSIEDKLKMQGNIASMVRQQVALYNKYCGIDHKIVLSQPAGEQQAHAELRTVTPPTDQIAWIDRNTNQVLHRPLAIRPAPALPTLDDGDDGDTEMGAEDPEMEAMIESTMGSNARSASYNGGFARALDEAQQQPPSLPERKKQKTHKHCAESHILKKLTAFLKKGGQYMNTCVSDSNGNWELQDAIIIHAQNREWTKNEPNGSAMFEIEGQMTRVTVFGRSQPIIKRVVNIFCRGLNGEDNIDFNMHIPSEGDDPFEKFSDDTGRRRASA